MGDVERSLTLVGHRPGVDILPLLQPVIISVTESPSDSRADLCPHVAKELSGDGGGELVVGAVVTVLVVDLLPDVGVKLLVERQDLRDIYFYASKRTRIDKARPADRAVGSVG